MNKDQLISEIQALNDQLATIEQQDQEQQGTSFDADKLNDSAASTVIPEVTDEASETEIDFVSEIYTQIEHGLGLNDETKQQLRKLVKEVEAQFEQLPKTACMSIFTAGIILGKVLK